MFDRVKKYIRCFKKRPVEPSLQYYCLTVRLLGAGYYDGIWSEKAREPEVHKVIATTPESSIYETETVEELRLRLTSYRELTSLTKPDWRDLPTVHHPTGYSPPPFRPEEWRGRSWTKDRS